MTNIPLPPLPEYGAVFEPEGAYNSTQMRYYATAAVLADREKRGEPVAWYWVEDPWGANEWHWMTDSPESQGCDPRDWTPVYAAPQPVERHKPLSDKEIEQESFMRQFQAARQEVAELKSWMGESAKVATLTFPTPRTSGKEAT